MQKYWDKRSENNDIWSVPVTSEMVNRAREGVWSIVLTPIKPVPANWFPDKLEEKRSYAWQAAEDNKDQYWRQPAQM